MMPDLEKVINGLECCCSQMAGELCRECPYADECEEGEGVLYGAAHLADDAITLLKAQEPKWISVKDRLPEKTERYMCLCYGFVTKSYWHELLWYENNHWWKSLETLEYDYKKHVVYWMPLPEPPKEET